MHVIRHQHVRVDRAAIVLGVAPQPVQIEPVILLREEARRAVVAALDDVQRHITNPGSRAAWHAPRITDRAAALDELQALSQAIRALLSAIWRAAWPSVPRSD